MQKYFYTMTIIFDLDEDVTTTFGDEFWKLCESVTSVLTHVDLQS